ncbi:MAG: phage major capsid protein, partial [Thermodesulfobacteriota bacterium]
VPFIEGYINDRLLFGLRQRLDTQVLLGDGAAPNLRGIKNVVGIQTQAKGADPTPDAFFKAMTKLRVTGRVMPTHHIIHPSDWEEIRLLRTADGIYIWGNPSESGPERMWGLPIVQQDADAAGTGYTISAQPAWMSLFEKRGVDTQVGYTGTQFVEGKRTIRADMRFAFVVFRPASICSISGI